MNITIWRKAKHIMLPSQKFATEPPKWVGLGRSLGFFLELSSFTAWQTRKVNLLRYLFSYRRKVSRFVAGMSIVPDRQYVRITRPDCHSVL